MGSAAFDAIGGAAINIQDIVPVVGEEEELYTGGFTIMTMTDGGETDQNYSYYTAEDAPDGAAKAGWFDGNGVRVNKVFQPGEGFVTVSDYEFGKIQSAGSVPTENTILAVGTGVNTCGNTTSADLSIQKIEVGVDVDENGELLAFNSETEEELYTGGFTVMTLTDGGETDANYSYYTAEDAPDGVSKAGWFDGAGVRVNLTFGAGTGFIIVSDYEGGYIALPSAL